MVVAALAVIIGVGAAPLLVGHYTSSNAKGITDGQAITFIQAGKGLPGAREGSARPGAPARTAGTAT